MAGSVESPRTDLNISSETTSAPEKPTERCGIVGIRTFEPAEHFDRLIRAGYGVQHRGQLGAGVRLVQENGDTFSHSGDGLISKVFTDEVIFKNKLMQRRGRLSGYHGRYGTEGDYGEGNLQPIIKKHHKTASEIAVFHNGQLVNIEGMRNEVRDEIEDGASDTQLFAEMLARSEGEDWDERILSTLDKVDGAYNLIIHVDDVMYVARDRFGLHPLVLGKISYPDTNGVIVASETSAFNEAGADYDRHVRRGEVFRVDDNGFTQLREGFNTEDEAKSEEQELLVELFPAEQLCAFELAYFERSDSLDPENRAIALTRERYGQLMAKRIIIPDASYVVGLPDSGTDMAIGYANEAGVPYKNYIKRNHYSPHGSQRAFQNDFDIPNIRSVVAKKLLYIPGPHWEDAVVIVGDDSAVRGSGSSEVTSKLFEFGAREVHWIFGFPPVKHPCHLAISMRTPEELIANQGDVAKSIGANSVNYILPDEFIRAYKGEDIVIPSDPSKIYLENNMCGGCLTGIHPITKEGVVWSSKEPDFIRK